MAKFITRLPFGLRPGMHVRLEPFEGNPPECGTYEGNTDIGVALIRLCDRHIHPGDDGLREVPYDQLRK